MDILGKIIEWDHQLFFLVNHGMANPFFDAVLPFIRESSIWVPLYLFMLVFICANFGYRGLLWFLIAGCTVALTDIVSSSYIKETIIRLRPCRDPELAYQIRFLVKYCPISSSFTSSHAANHFSVATFVYFTLKKYDIKWAWWFFVWAAAISFAQVYVGVHFPLDILCGGIVGFIMGYGMSVIFNRKISL